MDQVDKIVTGIIKFLRASGQIEILPAIIDRLEKELAKIKGESTALVTSAYPLNQAELEQIAKELLTIFDKKLEVVNKVDPGIIGGLVITVSDKVIDLSLNNYLESLRERLENEKN